MEHGVSNVQTDKESTVIRWPCVASRRVVKCVKASRYLSKTVSDVSSRSVSDHLHFLLMSKIIFNIVSGLVYHENCHALMLTIKRWKVIFSSRNSVWQSSLDRTKKSHCNFCSHRVCIHDIVVRNNSIYLILYLMKMQSGIIQNVGASYYEYSSTNGHISTTLTTYTIKEMF